MQDGAILRSRGRAPEVAAARVLIVDDELLIRWALRERLEEASFDVAVAATGSEARARFAQGCDVVLLDVRLPDADGMGLMGEFHAQVPSCPVILISAHPPQSFAKEALEAGAYAFVSKPFDIDEVARLVAQATTG